MPLTDKISKECEFQQTKGHLCPLQQHPSRCCSNHGYLALPLRHPPLDLPTCNQHCPNFGHIAPTTMPLPPDLAMITTSTFPTPSHATHRRLRAACVVSSLVQYAGHLPSAQGRPIDGCSHWWSTSRQVCASVIVSGASEEAGWFTTHTFRRGGAQYRFIYALNKWTLDARRWLGGWGEGAPSASIDAGRERGADACLRAAVCRSAPSCATCSRH